MRLDRDGLLLLCTLIPAGVLVYSFVMWDTTGVWPVSLPSVSLPALSVPAVAAPYTHLPPVAQNVLNRLTQNWWTIAAALAVGLIGGILLVGVVADIIKTAWFALKPAPRVESDEEMVDAEHLPEVTSTL